LVDCLKATKVFRRNKKDIELKILALLYFSLSLRKTSMFLSLFEEIGHEPVRIYHRLKIIKQPKTKEEKNVNSDRRNKIKLEKKSLYDIDVDTKECLVIWISEGRRTFEVCVFLKNLSM